MVCQITIVHASSHSHPSNLESEIHTTNESTKLEGGSIGNWDERDEMYKI